MTKRALSRLVLVAVTLAMVGCDDGKTTRIGVISPSAAFVNQSVSVAAPTVQSVPVPNAACPQSRFFAPFDLVVAADSVSDVFLTQIQMQFIDRAGALTPPTMITQPNLSQQFGSTRVPAAGSRTFPLRFPFGCTATPPGTLSLVVLTTDSQRRERQTPLRVPVR